MSGIVWSEFSDPVYNESLRVAVAIWATLVNTQTHTHTYRQTVRQTAFERLCTMLSWL